MAWDTWATVTVLSSLEEWEGNRLSSLAWAHAGPQQDPVLPHLGLLAMPSDPALAPLKWHLCPTCSQALPTGSPCLPIRCFTQKKSGLAGVTVPTSLAATLPCLASPAKLSLLPAPAGLLCRE